MADERDREDDVRRRLTAQRVGMMEDAMTSIGFAPGTVYWSVGRLVALLSVGWEPLVRSLDRLAADSDLAIASKVAANRKRSLRRALDELQSWGLITWETAPGQSRRRTRAEAMVTIRMDRRTI
ncbi:MAG: hypothetical protein AAFP90_16770, partial [Planctomycetota bacterium]